MILASWSSSTRLARRKKMAPLYGQARPALSSGNPVRPLAHRRYAPQGLTGPMTFDGRANSTAFRSYIDQGTGAHSSPARIVLMDNLPAHKGVDVRDAIQATLLLLPPYAAAKPPLFAAHP
jgi:hypothetical protein